jgi:hypothetical protein
MVPCPMSCRTATPVSAESELPPTTGHGCAAGLAGTTNTSTAEEATDVANQVVSTDCSHERELRLRRPSRPQPPLRAPPSPVRGRDAANASGSPSYPYATGVKRGS